ncbi:hypothetical protein P280DRAFT_510072 [Massarina eburnea CBS 473.64]|uniref:Uncharacterized protein n=1 Tax=Massarina eburnea CBS 473.64 TaxID=1395130 RepID=A0A6A6RPR4_9PLEO|nr:hypothetical protein P280DRAFT_510072 [Massarina eburnea CBS 473.64]
MLPSILPPDSSLSIAPLKKVPGKKHNFGAVITDLALNVIDAPGGVLQQGREVSRIPGVENRDHSPKVIAHWNDGAGQTMEPEPGLTDFFSNVQTHELISAEGKKLADHSWVAYAPFPFPWIGDCKGRANGLGLEAQGKEKKMEVLGEYDPMAVKTYPMVWVNPVMGEKASWYTGFAPGNSSCAHHLMKNERSSMML